MVVSLIDLPSELVHHISSILARGTISSERYLHEEPSNLLVKYSHPPLKHLSQTCRFLYDICFSYLFQALIVNAKDTSRFIAFINDHNLSGSIVSLVIWSDVSTSLTLRRPSPASEPATTSGVFEWLQVIALLDAAQPKSLTFVLRPETFQRIIPYTFQVDDAWAFHIAYQVLRLEQNHDTQTKKSPAMSAMSPNIFNLRPWTHMTFNEGSSIPAYSTYEYFHKVTPSLLCPSNPHSGVTIYEKTVLTSFDLIAVFPIDHMRRVCWLLSSMKSLRRLRTRFGPSANSGIMDDTEGLGKCQRSDLWLEFERAYRILTGSMRDFELQGISSHLEEFIALDYAQHGLREMINSAVSLESWGWQHDGEGSWTRLDETPMTTGARKRCGIVE